MTADTNVKWREVFSPGPRTTLILSALAVVVALLALRYVVRAPPRRLVIATDSPDGYFTRTAKLYGEKLAKEGVTLEIRTTKGAVDNIARIDAPGSDIDITFVHGGLTDATRSPNLESLGSIAYDPLWVVYRTKPADIADLGNRGELPKFRGHKIGVGRAGSGTEFLAKRVLAASGITADNATLVSDSDATDAPKDALLRDASAPGAVEVAFVMGPPEDPKIRALFAQDGLRVMSFSEADALSRNMTFLHSLKVPKATVDLARETPDRDLSIVASTITLVTRKDVHPALLYVLMSIVDEVHEPPSLLHKENEFPSDKDTDLPLSPQAEAYYKNGKPILQRYLPFALASAVERLLKVLVPVLIVLLPGLRGLPAFYQWRVKRKLARSYRQLLEIERQVQAGDIKGTPADYEEKLNAIQEKLHAESIPILYSNELYVLREHIDLARRHIAEALKKAA